LANHGFFLLIYTTTASSRLRPTIFATDLLFPRWHYLYRRFTV
jgi:hypothetical protein